MYQFVSDLLSFFLDVLRWSSNPLVIVPLAFLVVSSVFVLLYRLLHHA